MTRILLTLAALTTAIAVAAGCGNDGASSSGASSLAPAGALMYGEATLRPEGDQRAAIEALVERFPGQGTAGDRIGRLLEKAFSESDSGLSYEQDVEPWLGDEAAIFFTSFSPDGEELDGAALVATEDEDRAMEAVEKATDGRRSSYKDVDYVLDGEDASGVVDGWVVLGTEAGFKAVVDTVEGGSSLDEDERYEEALADAPAERLGFFYVNSPAFLDELEKSGAGAALGEFRRFFEDPVLVTLDADHAGLRFEAAVPATAAAGFPFMAEGSDLAGELPADAWLAMAQPELGKTVEQYVDLIGKSLGGRDVIEQQFRASTGLDLERDVLSWMGDWRLFVRGESLSELNGALMVETSDEAASGRVIDAVARLLRENAGQGESVAPLALGGGGEGVTLRSDDLPEPVHLFQRDGQVVLAYGDAAARDALDPAERLGDSAAFADASEALGGDYAISFYLAIEPILSLADSAGAASDEDWQEVRPYLEPLGALVGGARKDGEKLRSALGLTVP
jgi:hypothetical protein